MSPQFSMARVVTRCDACDHRVMHLPRTFELSSDARAAVAQLLGIMSDQVMDGANAARWDYDELMRVEYRFAVTMGIDDVGAGSSESVTVTVGMEDVAALLDGMAYTEVMSEGFAWIDMVRWTADFITSELRGHWTDEEWRQFTAAGVRHQGWSHE